MYKRIWGCLLRKPESKEYFEYLLKYYKSGKNRHLQNLTIYLVKIGI